MKGFEIGSGFEASKSCGSINNDEFYIDKNGIKKYTNNSGGILGGMSDGSDIIFRAAFKPTPSIHKTQKTVNLNGENIEININGRHDPIVVPRAVVVVEAMAALTIVDYLFMNMFSKMESIKKFYTEKFRRWQIVEYEIRTTQKEKRRAFAGRRTSRCGQTASTGKADCPGTYPGLTGCGQLCGDWNYGPAPL